MTTTAYISLGSNLGDRRSLLERAVADLRRAPGVEVQAVSAWIETEPVDVASEQPRYLNGVLRAICEGTAAELLDLLLSLESRAGRVRREPNGARTLDLDLLLFGDEHSDDPRCTVPHPRLEERLFVLEPLGEIDPDLILPSCGRSVSERLRELCRGEPARTGP